MMNIIIRLLLFWATVAMLMIESSEGLVCYQCSYNSPCADPFNPNSVGILSVTCISPNNACGKLTTQSSGVQMVNRYCTMATKTKCYATLTGDVCTCLQDKCNGGYKVASPVIQMLLMALLTSAVAKLFWE